MKLKRVLKSLTTVVVVLTLVLSTFAPALAANVKNVKIVTKIAEMSVSSSKQLEAVTTPKGVKVTWKTDNKKVASVSKDGKVNALAEGKVKITAAAGSKSDSVTINVVKKDTKTAPTKDTETKTETKKETKKVNPNEKLVNGDFESGIDPWVGSFGCMVEANNKEFCSGKNSLYVSGRTMTADGPKQDITGKVVAGHTYEYSCKIKYTKGPDSKDFNMDIQNGQDWTGIDIMGTTTVKKGEWATISGTYTVPATDDLSMSFIFVETPFNGTPDEANDLFDFYVDDLSFVDTTK